MCDKLKNLIINQSRRKILIDDISNDTNIIEDLNFDSIEIVTLILIIENTFEITFPDDTDYLDVFSNFQKTLCFIESLKK